MTLLCQSPLYKKVFPIVKNYLVLNYNDRNAILSCESKNYSLLVFGEFSKEELNEIRIFALGCYETLVYYETFKTVSLP